MSNRFDYLEVDTAGRLPRPRSAPAAPPAAGAPERLPATPRWKVVEVIGGPGTAATLADADVGQAVDVWTTVAPATLKAERGDDLALSASLVSLVLR